MKTTRIFLHIRCLAALAISLFALGLPGVANAAEAGKFQFVIGDIKVISASGAERTPVKGEAFSPGETIITGASGSAQIRMTDGGLVAVRPDTQMKLDQYVFNGREDGSERKLVSLIKGGFRAITGLIGNRNKQNYKILTPSATIGIRGTDHEAVVIVPGAAGGFQAGTYDRVYRGATIIETDRGKLIVNPNQVGFTPGKGVAPVLLPKIPEFFDSKAQRPDAAKESRKDAKDSDGGDTKKTDSRKGTTGRSLSNLKNDLGTGKDTATTLRSPLDATTVKDLGTTTLTTPLSDTTLKSDALIEPITVPTTTLKTDVLTAPTTTTTTTIKAPTTTTIISPITTTIAPITTTTKITEPVIAPTTSTTTILKSPTTTTTTISR
jgi:hypothetical protein